MLQRDRRQGNVAIRVGRAPSRELFVVQLDDLGRELAFGAIEPKAIDAQHLNVDSSFVQRPQALRPHHVGSTRPIADIGSELRVLDDVPHLRHDAVSVHIDDFYTPASYEHLAARGGGGLRQWDSGIHKSAASCHEHSGRGARHGLQETPAIRHGLLRYSAISKLSCPQNIAVLDSLPRYGIAFSFDSVYGRGSKASCSPPESCR